MDRKKRQPKNKTGPEPERIKLNKPWERAVSDALRKERPAEGWPDQPKPKQSKTKPSPPRAGFVISGGCMKIKLLAIMAKLLGIQFHVCGLPYGASYHRRAGLLSQSAQSEFNVPQS